MPLNQASVVTKHAEDVLPLVLRGGQVSFQTERGPRVLMDRLLPTASENVEVSSAAQGGLVLGVTSTEGASSFVDVIIGQVRGGGCWGRSVPGGGGREF